MIGNSYLAIIIIRWMVVYINFVLHFHWLLSIFPLLAISSVVMSKMFCIMNLHCTVMLTVLLSLPIKLEPEHVYTPVSSLEAFVIVKALLTLVIFPSPTSVLTVLFIDTPPLSAPLFLFHITVGGG